MVIRVYLLLILFVVCNSAWAQVYLESETEVRIARKFVGENLPIGPLTNEPYLLENGTDQMAHLVSVAEVLFEAGLADPRGCEYRDVSLGVGSCWGGERYLIKTAAWVIPSETGETERFAISWNGLVYPVEQVGELADLEGHISHLIKKKEQSNQEDDRGQWIAFGMTGDNEGESCHHVTLYPLKACMMLRLGLVREAVEYLKLYP
ncbi:MAG: hypothetical protein AAF226_02630, partial [Verrucomicrobiota bacterium]